MAKSVDTCTICTRKVYINNYGLCKRCNNKIESNRIKNQMHEEEEKQRQLEEELKKKKAAQVVESVVEEKQEEPAVKPEDTKEE